MKVANQKLDDNISFKLENIKRKIPLLESLREYSLRDIASFDVPGHVKNQGVPILNDYFGEYFMKMDINSSPLMDNVSNSKGIIKEAQKLLAKAYGADYGFFITGGTTQAIHAMILSIIKPGEKILLPRNIHKSVINALILSGGIPVFIEPEYDCELGISMNINTNQLEKSLEEYKDIKALFLLNPTYYGMCSKLDEIVKICHKNKVLVLVDEAHGAHFPFHNDLPDCGISVGADMCAISIHKTGGALTQASAIVVNDKNIDIDALSNSINMLQSTSASYILMASIDGARANLVLNGESQLSKALNLSRYARSKLNKIEGIYVSNENELNDKDYIALDETKLCINVRRLNLTGFEVYDLLYKEFDIQVELGDMYNILALVSIGTTKENVDKLITAIKIIAKLYIKSKKNSDIKISQINPIVRLSPRDAFYSKKESIDIDNCINRISGECIMAYPPGIPIVSPGEIITKEIIDYIKLLKLNNAYLTDMKDKTLKSIFVVYES